MPWKQQRTLTDVLRHAKVRSLSFRCANGSPSKVVSCPSCSRPISASHINDHLDRCLQVNVETSTKNALEVYSEEVEASIQRCQCKENFSGGDGSLKTSSVPKDPEVDREDSESPNNEKLSVQMTVFKHILSYSLFNYSELLTEDEKQVAQQSKSWHSIREFSNLRYNDSYYSEDDFYLLQNLALIQPFHFQFFCHLAETLDILSLLNVKELKQAFRLMFFRNVDYKGKEKLVSDLCKYLSQEAVIYGIQRKLNGHSPRKDCWSYILSQLGYVFRVPDEIAILFDNLCRLCCIQSFPETPLILLAAMDKLKFPRYICSCTRPIFLSRDAFLEFTQAEREEEIFTAALDSGLEDTVVEISSKAHIMLENYRQAFIDKESVKGELSLPSLEQVVHPVFKVFSGLWIFCNICWHSIVFLERRKDFETSIRRLFLLLEFKEMCSHRRGRYWNRLSLDILHSGGCVLDALKACKQALEDEHLNDGERVTIARRAARLIRIARRKGELENSSILIRELRKLLSYSFLNNHIRHWHSLPEDVIVGRPLLSVEELCLEHYALQGWNGIHCEGSLMNTLFGIFFWNILFMDISDVFQNEYQRAPLDLGTEAFYNSRSSAVEQRLLEIRHYDKKDIFREVLTVFQEHGFEECVGVNWLILGSMETLALVASLIPSPVLAGCFEKLSKNYKYWSGGQPDLFLWRELPEEQVKFVEVKGPSDKLSERQHFWICLLLSFGANASVAKVRPEH
ncbi:Fanconi-associated nuclease 1 [Galdieria sulphuraria]|nr:Fanconi-associated nuclease 1 [Galdieria sulphuraria]